MKKCPVSEKNIESLSKAIKYIAKTQVEILELSWRAELSDIGTVNYNKLKWK